MISLKYENGITRFLITSPYIKGVVVLKLQGRFELAENSHLLVKWAEGNYELPQELDVINAYQQLVF